MKCELCGAETEFLYPYYCYYGKLIRSEINQSPNVMYQTTTTTLKYHLGGEKSSCFCDRCVAMQCGMAFCLQSVFAFFITSLLIILSLVLYLLVPHETVTSITIIFALLAIVGSLLFLFHLWQGVRALIAVYGDPNTLHTWLKYDPSNPGFLRYEYMCNYGDGMILKREKGELRKAGFDSFFTRRNKPRPIQPPA
jgi:hypothetical protein